MNFDSHIGIKVEKAECAFLHLTSTSSSVSPVVVIRPPSYVKAVPRSRTWPVQLMLPMFARDWILVSLVLVTFTSIPTLAACSCSASNFWSLSLRRSPSSAKPCRPQCPSPDHPHGWDPILLQDLPEHLPINRIKGFLKFSKNSCSPVFHSKVYSTIIASEVVWSQQYFPLRNPACLFRLPACLVCLQENPSSFLENSYAKNFNLLTTETSKMPRQLSQRDRTPLLESLPLRSTNFKKTHYLLPYFSLLNTLRYFKSYRCDLSTLRGINTAFLTSKSTKSTHVLFI